MRPPKKATGAISLIFLWHESNRPEVVVGAVAVGPIMCAGDRNILTRLLKPSIFVNVVNFLGRRLNCFSLSVFLRRQFFFWKLFSFDCSLPFTWLYFANVCDRFLSAFTLQRTFFSLSPFMQHIKLLAQSNFSFVSDETFPNKLQAEKKLQISFFFVEHKNRETFSIRQSIFPVLGSFSFNFAQN